MDEVPRPARRLRRVGSLTALAPRAVRCASAATWRLVMTPVLLPVSYDPWLIVLSWMVSAIGAFTALSAIGRARQTASGRVDRFNVLLAGVALGGVGIWSMHFIGMLAWKVDLGVGYRLLETMVSLVAAVIVSALALGFVAAGPGLWRLLVAGPLAGIGGTVMHYPV